MGKKKNKGSKPVFNPPTRMPSNTQAIMNVIKRQYDAEITAASNNTFSLIASAMLIAYKDLGASNEMVKELLDKCFSVLDDVADSLATIDANMRLVESWGIEIHNVADSRLTDNDQTLLKRTSVFECLENGFEEIEDILRICKQGGINISYRDACAIRWEYNRRKYYKDLEGCIDLSKRDKALALLDKGATTEQIMDVLDCTKHSVYNYVWMWNKETAEERAARQAKGEGESAMSKKKKKAFELIKNGAGAKELMKEMGISQTSAYKFLETYRNEVDGGEIKVTTNNMKEAFKLFDQAKSDIDVCETLQLGKATIFNYRQEWLRINKADLTSDEMASVLAEEITLESAILTHKKVYSAEVKNCTPNTKETLTSENKGEVSNDTKAEIKESDGTNKTGEASEGVREKEEVIRKETSSQKTESEVQQVQGRESVLEEVKPVVKDIEENKEVSVVSVKAKSLKKVVKVIEIQGEFTTYKPVGPNTFDMEIDGQVITLSRDQMRDFGEELLAVAEEEI